MPSESNNFEATKVDYGPASVIASGGKISAAFPAYRVFIFGQEVTSDVLEVRVNNSGGSAERSAGTCSFTLVNPDNKYTLTYSDMVLIAQGAAAYREERKKHWVNNGFGGTTPLEVKKIQMAVDLWQTEHSCEDYREFTEDYIQQGRQDEIPQEVLDKIKVYDENMVENKAKVDEAYREVAKNLIESSYMNPFSALNLESWSSQEAGTNTMKANVLEEKLVFHVKVDYKGSSASSKLEETGILMTYPFQQGDCVFSPNDPVRVAFRDPFDPRVWYWMFTGFMDAWTENSGVNMDSTITINCTDVTKMARYSYIQIGVGLQDPNIADVFTQINEASSGSKQVQYFGELFAHFTMLDALNALFFGTEMAQTTTEDVILAQVAQMSDEALRQYMLNLDPTNPEFQWEFAPENLRQLVTEAKSEEIRKLIAQAGKLPPLSVPAPFMRGVKKGGAETDEYEITDGSIVAKKKSSRWGVHAYFYGAMTEQDKAMGEELVSLHAWNETIHHRVRPYDLVDMALDEAEYGTKGASIEEYKPAWIITEIGRNKTKYPVGHGRVYYVSRAQLADGNFGRNIIDKSMGGNSGLFSIFKDKLSYIYDMVDRVDFRFYATPKGDFVYEMPFYDFDPIYFTSDSMEDWELKAVQMQDFLALSGSEDIPFSEQDLEAIGFFKSYTETKGHAEWSSTEPYDYTRHFTIEREEQLGFSNTATDQGVVTAARCKPQNVAGLAAINGDIKKNQWAVDAGAVASLGVRVADVDAWGFITSEEEAQMYAGLMLSRLNAEAKNVSVATLPKFGLMVNRPLFWRERNYYANIVSLQHSIVWASSADTTVNLNQLRGWSGETHKETGYPIHKHFSGSDRPFSMGELSTRSTSNQNTQGS